MLMPEGEDFRFLAVFLALATAADGVRDFGLLQPHPGSVSQRRRRLPGGLEAVGAESRRRLRLRICWSIMP